MLERWTLAVLRARALVIAAWLVIFAAGVFAATQLPALLATSFDVPGTESERARALLEKHFDERPEGTFVVVFRGDASDKVLRRRLERRLEIAARQVPSGESRELRDRRRDPLRRDRHASRTGRREAAHGVAAATRFASSGGPRASVTGQPAIQHDLDPLLAADLRRGEAVALPLALAVLVVVFGVSLAAVDPVRVRRVHDRRDAGGVYRRAHVLPMVTYATNLVELIGLGLAIDYSLLFVYRYREELAPRATSHDAIVRTMPTAGRAVVFSGLAVAIGLALLSSCPCRSSARSASPAC